MKRGMLTAALVLTLVSSVLLAKPGTLTTLDGQVMKGEITEKDGKTTVDQPGGAITMDSANVKSVVYDKTADDEYAERHAKLDAKDVKGRMTLAAWASDHDRADLAVQALTEARKIDPMDKAAASALDTAQIQADLDAKAKAKAAGKGTTTAPAAPTQTPTTAPATGVPTAPPAAEKKLGVRRLLTADEINLIRQKEMPTDDPKVRIRFDNQVVKKYLATGNHDAAAFQQLSPEGQALEILTNGDPSLAKDVTVMTDPTPVLEFKVKVMPLIASGCGSPACHGGNKGGTLGLFPSDSTPGVYTNFYIMMTYSTQVGGVKYMLMDRESPDRSLVLQYGLPAAAGQPPHPAVPGYRPRFKSSSDPAYQVVFGFLHDSLRGNDPNYDIDVSPKIAGPARAVTPATKPAN
jgi:hypothetical protein